MDFLKKPDAGILRLLRQSGIPEEENEWCGFCIADLSLNCDFQEYWLLFTKKDFIMVTLPPETGVRTFAGYPEKAKKPLPEAGELHTLRIGLSSLAEAGVDELVSGGSFFIRENEEDRRRLCVFSCGRTAGARRFCEVLNKVMKGEDPSEEDYRSDRRERFCEKCGMPFPDPDRAVCPACSKKRSIFMRLLSYFAPHKGRIALMLLCFLAATLLETVLPYFTGTIFYDWILARSAPEWVRTLTGSDFFLLLGISVGISVCVKIVSQAFGSLQAIFVARIVPPVVCRIKETVFGSLKRLSIKFFTDRQTGPLMTRVLGDAQSVTGFFIDGLPYMIGNLITVVAVTIIMFSLNWKLTVFSLVLIPLLGYLSFKLQPRLWHLYGKRFRASRGMNSALNDSITGVRVIKAFGRENEAVDAFERQNASAGEAETSVARFEARYGAVFSASESLLTVSAWIVGALMILNGSGLTYGMLASFVIYISYLSRPMDFMANFFRWLAESMNAAQRIFEIIDAVPDVAEAHTPRELTDVRGEITLKNVTFSYEKGKPVLKNISAVIPAGSVFGIVGRSGVGKTTLVNLISRLYDVDSGSVSIDGTDVRDLSFASLRRAVAMVSQDSFVFMGTVAENIAYADPKADRAKIVSAARAAGAHDFICKMPDGYDTVIGSGGRAVSGGERQRLSVARAILQDPKILILDEATASVDTATERSIQAALDRLVKGRTTLSIAHRLSTLNNADRLLVLDDGEVAESGTHAELMKHKGIYYKLADLQKNALSLQKTEEELMSEEKTTDAVLTDEVPAGEGEELQAEIRELTAGNAVFARTDGGFVSLEFDGKKYDRIQVCPAFPFTDPDRFLSVREWEGKNREIGVIMDINTLPEETAAMLHEQIGLRYFTPRVEKIHDIREEYGYSYWDVTTDRGRCRFTADSGGISRLSPVRLLITDIQGNRFELRDVSTLTVRELRLIDLYI